MSEKMTRIRLKHSQWHGQLEWGEKTSREMVEKAVEWANHMRKVAQDVLDAADEDFQIDVVRGPYVQHHIKNLQKGRS